MQTFAQMDTANLLDAVRGRRVVELSYRGSHGIGTRIIQPHVVYRTSRGRLCLDGVQIAGDTSSGTLPAGGNSNSCGSLTSASSTLGLTQLQVGTHPPRSTRTGSSPPSEAVTLLPACHSDAGSCSSSWRPRPADATDRRPGTTQLRCLGHVRFHDGHPSPSQNRTWILLRTADIMNQILEIWAGQTGRKSTNRR